jgi:hypothetical protein
VRWFGHRNRSPAPTAAKHRCSAVRLAVKTGVQKDRIEFVSRAFHPAALEDNAPAFRSLHFLAPAIRVDAFEQRLLDKIGAEKRRCWTTPGAFNVWSHFH